MTEILAFITSRAGRAVAASLLVIALMVGCTVQRHQLKAVRADLKEARAALYVPGTKVTWRVTAQDAQANLNVCHGDRDSLMGALGRQNAALAALQADGARRVAETSRALQAARKQGAAALAEANRILGITPEGSDTCARLLDAERQISEGP
jgi:hypothetical protein